MILRKAKKVKVIGRPIIDFSGVERVSMSLGRQILHGIYCGVDAGTVELLHGEYDKEFGVVDPVSVYHTRTAEGQLIADKFDRHSFIKALRSAQSSTVLSPVSSSPETSPSGDPVPSSEN